MNDGIDIRTAELRAAELLTISAQLRELQAEFQSLWYDETDLNAVARVLHRRDHLVYYQRCLLDNLPPDFGGENCPACNRPF